MSRESVLGRAAVGVHVDAREALAGELVGNNIPRCVNRRARTMDRGRALGVPSCRLLARVLHAHGLAHGSGQDSSIHGRVVRIAASIGPRSNHPDRARLLLGHVEGKRNSVANEMRLLRAGPAGDIAVLDLGYRTGGTHTGV